MNMTRCTAGVASLVLMAVCAARANNLQVTHVTVKALDKNTAFVQFDISWDNSWNYTNVNHDAAWVFFKALPEASSNWQHVILQSSGTNPPGCSAGRGTAVELVVPPDRVGLFVRRSGEGSGSLSVSDVRVVWNLASSGLTSTDRVRIRAVAVEMVFVAEGSFAAGSGGTENSPFMLTTIHTDKADTAPSGSGSLGGQAGGYPTGQAAPNADWPNGYRAFYCMKHEITEGQWVDFFNALTATQKVARDITGNVNGGKNSDGVMSRNTVAWDSSNPTNSARTAARDRVCCYLCWADVCAYFDWAGLRPMTELEFEKACRGPLVPVANEYAWGSTTIIGQTGHASGDGSGQDLATPANANCCYNQGVSGPVRAGIFATAASSREAAGASYWGIMELTGNAFEQVVTVGHATGRAFTGLHGNGNVTAAGAADVLFWPASDGNGAGIRGGCWYNGSAYARTSDRKYANSTVVAGRDNTVGGRGVRGI